jgi:molecular chaperone DnaJ
VGESYYDLLGVDADASTEAIEQAYRERLKETHPDVSDHENASDRTKLLIEARDVLIDETERARYDRLGHEAYVGLEDGTVDGSAESSSAAESAGGTDQERTATASKTTSRQNRSGSTAQTQQGTRNSRRRGRGRHVRDNRETAGGKAAADSWYSGNDEPGWEDGGDNWRTWNTDGSFAVERDGDPYQYGRMFVSQRSLILLGSTFLVYPVLLFGALFPGFPLAANLTVGMCVVLVIAFLQSIPEVGIAVFGLWSVLLPMVLVWLGIELLSLVTLLAMVAVVFPLFLSVLTRLAIRPRSAG